MSAHLKSGAAKLLAKLLRLREDLLRSTAESKALEAGLAKAKLRKQIEAHKAEIARTQKLLDRFSHLSLRY